MSEPHSASGLKRSGGMTRPENGLFRILRPGTFDGVIAAVGTCGSPKMPHIASQDKFQGKICHSSKLIRKKVEGEVCYGYWRSCECPRGSGRCWAYCSSVASN